MAAQYATPGPWQVVKDDDQWRLRQKGAVRRIPGGTVERPVAEGFNYRLDAVLAGSAPELRDALKDLLSDYLELDDSGDAGNLRIRESAVGVKAINLLERLGVSI